MQKTKDLFLEKNISANNLNTGLKGESKENSIHVHKNILETPHFSANGKSGTKENIIISNESSVNNSNNDSLNVSNNTHINDQYIDDHGFQEFQESKFQYAKRLLNVNFLCLVFISLVFILLALILPILITRISKKKNYITLSKEDLAMIAYAKNTTSKGQPLVPKTFRIDPDTPDTAKLFKSSTNEFWQLVFSDEFNQDGRKFGPGDDPVWEAQDLHYWPTNDLEYYHPKQVTTKNGSLQLTIDKIKTDKNFDYTSGMMNSWNKFCFQGGYIEVRASFPGDGKAQGFWPAAWTLGNLGRAGYGASNDGTWPYTYNSCDNGVLVNQTNSFLSHLPGQRLNACVCKGDHPSPGIGRGAPEIDIFEGATRGGETNTLSMSLQVAPFDFHYTVNNTHTKIFDKADYNSYTGGELQQSVSAIYTYDPLLAGKDKYGVYGFEYLPGPDGYVQWYADGKPVYRVSAKAIGPNPLSKVTQRLISEEPMYLLLNLGMSNSWSSVELEKLAFPSTLKFDYVRLYQHPDRIRLSCDPPDRPTADYIMNHPRAYYNKYYRFWTRRYAKSGFIEKRFSEECLFCRNIAIKTIEHMLLECSRWQALRADILAQYINIYRAQELKLSSTRIRKNPTVLCVKTTLATAKFFNAIALPRYLMLNSIRLVPIPPNQCPPVRRL
ncbi:hypothetical protein BB561_006415 [Smittium simulii]|uniref:GH16 domain-containing protein n=1 Tax=Smittium simulii TaxID=133385 RepID=A0A2T9Y4H5_9FUNG|nr:hypothetical protein BB561_006415 [Smittium simulii]